MARDLDLTIRITGDAASALAALEETRRAQVETFGAGEAAAKKQTAALQEQRIALAQNAAELQRVHAAAAQQANLPDVAGAFKRLDIRPLSAIRAEMAQLQTAYDNIKKSGVASSSELQRAHTALEAKLRQLRIEASGTGQSFLTAGSFSSAFLGVLGKITAGATAVAAALAAIAVPTARLEDIQTRLKGLAESGADYQRVWDTIVELAHRQHQALDTVAESEAQLLNIEHSGLITRKQNIALLEGFNNIAAKAGASSAQMGQSMYGLSQALASGTVRAEELNQIVEPLPGLLAALDKAAGLPAGGFRRMVADGKVTSEFLATTLVKAFKSYEGAAESTAGNISAHWKDLQTRTQEILTDQNSAINRLATGTLDFLGEELASVNDFLNAAKREWEDYVGFVDDLFADDDSARVYMDQIGLIQTVFRQQAAAAQQSAQQIAAVQSQSATQSAAAWTKSADEIKKHLDTVGSSAKDTFADLDAAQQARTARIEMDYAQRRLQIAEAGQSEIAQAKQVTQLLIAENQARIAADQQHANRKLALIDTVYQQEIGDAKGSAEAEAAVSRASAETRRTIWQGLQESYRQTINGLIAEDQRHLQTIQVLERQKADMQRSLESEVRELQRAGMSDLRANLDRQQEAAESLSRARRELAAGDLDAAEKSAQAAKGLYGEVARMAEQARKTGDGSKAAADKFVENFRQAGTLLEQIVDAKIEAEKAQHEALQESIKITGENLERVQAMLKGIDDQLIGTSPLMIRLDEAAYASVRQAIDLLVAPETKTILVQYVEQRSGGGEVGVQQYAEGGELGSPIHAIPSPRHKALSDGLQRFSEGGQPIRLRPGLIAGPGTATSDSIVARVSAGEHAFITKAERARQVWPLLNYLNFADERAFHEALSAIRSARIMDPAIPAFAEGGAVSSRIVDRLVIPSLAGGSGVAPNRMEEAVRRDVVDINLNLGGRRFPLQSSRDVARGLAQALRELAREGV